MKPTGFHLLICVVAGPLAAQEPVEPTRPAKTSARLTQEIRVTLPRFAPPPPRVLDQPKTDGAENDFGVLALPKLTVKEKRPPSHDPDVWLTDLAIKQKALAAYRQSMTDLEWALNSWHIPLLSPSAAARARAAYESGKSLAEIKRVHDLFGRIAARDSQAAAELEKERVKMHQTEYWQSRPAGDGRKK